MMQFILNDQIIRTSIKSGVTLLDFIREHQQLKGTKIGCREGDCGACTILVGTLIEDDVFYQTITSCISPLGNAAGKHIVTIEGVNLTKELNTAQKAMADNYATQCGFCTPGFVVSMTGFALKKQESSNCNDAISGNICRCTGYKSIERAGLEIERKLAGKDVNHKLDWLIKERFIPNYFTSIPQKLKELNKASAKKSFDKEKLLIKAKVASGTDLYVHNADKMAEEDVLLLVEDHSLKGISFENGVCTLGANTTVTEILENQKLQEFIPGLRKFLNLVASEPIRNMGTIGGNFVNASPIGDMSIFFLALNSTLTIRKDNGAERKIPFHTFHRNYKVYDLQKDEILKNIFFNLPLENDFFNFEKVSKRTFLDIASVNSAGRILVKDGKIAAASISVGGVAAVPKFLLKTNNFLTGKPLDAITIKRASKILDSEISPISDVRGSSTYKSLLAKQLFFAHFLELFPNQIELEKLLDEDVEEYR